MNGNHCIYCGCDEEEEHTGICLEKDGDISGTLNSLVEHASLECPECGAVCRPKRENKDEGASYVCHNIIRHANCADLPFRIDGDGELHF